MRRVLKQGLTTTDGNLGAHLLKLEEAGYVSVEKKFQGRKPVTLYRMTHAGRVALEGYVASLKELLGWPSSLERPDLYACGNLLKKAGNLFQERVFSAFKHRGYPEVVVPSTQHHLLIWGSCPAFTTVRHPIDCLLSGPARKRALRSSGEGVWFSSLEAMHHAR